MRGDWSLVKLGDLVEVKHGYAFEGRYFSNDPPGPILVTPGNFSIGGGFNRQATRYFRGDVPKTYQLTPGDLVVTMTDLSKAGDTLGYSAIIPDDHLIYLHNQRIGKIVNLAPERLSLDFAYWLLRSPAYRAEVLASATGSTVRHTSPSRIQAFRFALPVMREQLRIAELLGALDSKIELNRRMAETLEEIAKSLFKSWFVSFDPIHARAEGGPTGLPDDLAALFPDSFGEDAFPEGWVALAGDVGHVVRVSVEPQHIDQGTPYVGLEHLERGSLVIRQYGSAADVDSLKTLFKRGDLLFGKLRPYFNKVAIAPFDGICSSDILVFRPGEGVPSAFLYLCFSEPGFVAAASNASSGTRMPRADWAYMRRLPTALPPPALLHAFSEATTPLLSAMLSSATQSRTLAALRDILLPRLISGELRVTDAVQRVAAA